MQVLDDSVITFAKTCHQRDAKSIKCRRRRWRNWTQCRGWCIADVSMHIKAIAVNTISPYLSLFACKMTNAVIEEDDNDINESHQSKASGIEAGNCEKQNIA